MAAATKAPKGFTEVAPAEVPAKKKREKKEKVKRTLWGTRDEKGNLVEKITGTTIEGFDSKLHLPLRRRDFNDPIDYLKLNVERAEATLARAKKELADESALGNVEQRKKVKQAKSPKQRFSKMQAERKESGMTDEQLAQILS